MRINMKNLLLIIVIIAFSFCTGYSEEEIPNFDNVQIVTTHASGNVYILEATGKNLLSKLAGEAHGAY